MAEEKGRSEPGPTGRLKVVVLSGLSGSGKTTALHALEDAGFFCVDNLPVPLFPPFLTLMDDNPAITSVAVAMDVRERLFRKDLIPTLTGLASRGYETSLVFLDCGDDVLTARFKTTRRRHPMVAQGEATSIGDAISLERQWVAPIKSYASRHVDTTQLTVHQLKQRIQELYGSPGSTQMGVHLMSFGFRHGVPQEADYMFDVRFLDNPYFVSELRSGTGRDAPVADYVMGQDAAQRLLDQIVAMIGDVLPRIEDEGRATMTIAIGCTGGHHRSVALCEALASRLGALRPEGPPLVRHRDIDR